MQLALLVMKRWFLLLILALALPATPAMAEESGTLLAEQCPASILLTRPERQALVSFNSRLSGLWKYYGKDSFEPRLRELLRNHDASAKVIEISPLFLEKVLYIADVYRLRHAIERTIGLKNKKWKEFERTMWSVVMHGSIYSSKHGIFEKKVQDLMVDIRKSNTRYTPLHQYPMENREAYIQEGIARVADMYITIRRLDGVNRQSIDERAEAASRQLAIVAVGLIAGGVVVAGTAMGPGLVTAAGAYAGGLSSSSSMSLILTGLGEVVAGAGLGIVGAPTGKLLMDAGSAHLGAKRQGQNLRTKYSCELGKQIAEIKAHGTKPYVDIALYGAGIGAVGGLATFAGLQVSRTILLASSFGVGVAQAYSMGQLSEYTLESLAEYRLAMDEINKGNRPAALIHLHKSRDFAQKAGEVGIQTVIVSVLSVSIASEFKFAIIQGGAAIRAIFANSSDTLPLSMQIVQEVVDEALAPN